MGRAFEFRKARKMKRWSKMAKTFTRIGKDIVIAVKEGGPSPETNSRLRQVMQNAKAANMPKDNVLRAIKKASSKNTENYNEVSLEGYAANGIAVFIDCATNNNNRTVADVRSYFSKCGGALGTNGSLEFIFNRKGVFTIERDRISIPLDDLEMELIDGGLEELEIDNEEITIYCDFHKFSSMQKKIEELNIEITNSELQRIPTSTKRITTEQSQKVLNLLDLLEENDDVQQVFHNMELTEDLLKVMDTE
jgi:YebC/PmpR family DNA-binding regulatory protein